MTWLLRRAWWGLRGWWWSVVYAGRPTVITLYRLPKPGGGLYYVRLRHWVRGGPTPSTRIWLADERKVGHEWEECRG